MINKGVCCRPDERLWRCHQAAVIKCTCLQIYIKCCLSWTLMIKRSPPNRRSQSVCEMNKQEGWANSSDVLHRFVLKTIERCEVCFRSVLFKSAMSILPGSRVDDLSYFCVHSQPYAWIWRKPSGGIPVVIRPPWTGWRIWLDCSQVRNACCNHMICRFKSTTSNIFPGSGIPVVQFTIIRSDILFT